MNLYEKLQKERELISAVIESPPSIVCSDNGQITTYYQIGNIFEFIHNGLCVFYIQGGKNYVGCSMFDVIYYGVNINAGNDIDLRLYLTDTDYQFQIETGYSYDEIVNVMMMLFYRKYSDELVLISSRQSIDNRIQILNDIIESVYE